MKIIREQGFVQSILIALLSSFTLSNAESATVYISKNHRNADSVFIEGPIESGDFEKVVKKTRQVLISGTPYPLSFSLNSSGGNIKESIKIGRYIRDLRATTIAHGRDLLKDNSVGELTRDPSWPYSFKIPSSKAVTSDSISICYSACVLIFYAGVNRHQVDNHVYPDEQSLPELIPVMGLHRPYYKKEYYSKLSSPEAGKAYTKLTEVVRSYLSEMGAPSKLIERMLQTSSGNVDLVTRTEFSQYYSEVEPFHEEWLTAKCGSGTAEEVLSDSEIYLHTTYYEAAKTEAKQAVKRALVNNRNLNSEDVTRIVDATFATFTLPNVSPSEIERINKLLRDHASKVQSCKLVTLYTHQLDFTHP